MLSRGSRRSEAVREKGDEGAYKTAFAYAAQERSLVQEMKAVGEALTARFGWSAFTGKADQYAEKQMVERMPEGASEAKREELTTLFAAARRLPTNCNIWPRGAIRRGSRCGGLRSGEGSRDVQATCLADARGCHRVRSNCR